MPQVTASAPGKCILFGEHAVVYGHPAVAVAIEQRISIKIQPSQTGKFLLNGNNLDLTKNPHLSGLLDKLWPIKRGAPPLSFLIEGSIPPAAGLGSSAALSVATVAALRRARGRWISGFNVDDHAAWAEGYSSKITHTNAYSKGSHDITVNDDDHLTHIFNDLVVDLDECAILGHSVEVAAQSGRASPMDSSTCAHGGIIIISDIIEQSLTHLYSRSLAIESTRTQWQIHQIRAKFDEEVYLVIGNTGIHAPTGKQVASVANMLNNQPERINEIDAIGKIARRGIKALIEGDYDLVGKTMTENQIMLKQIGVSSPEREILIKAAIPSSLGVKLTGAGGGGCMVALTRNPQLTSEAIELAGGRTLISKIGAPGVRVDSASEIPLWKSR